MLGGVGQKLSQIFGHKILRGSLQRFVCFFCGRVFGHVFGRRRGEVIAAVVAAVVYPCPGVWPSRSPTGPGGRQAKRRQAKPSNAGRPRARSSSLPPRAPPSSTLPLSPRAVSRSSFAPPLLSPCPCLSLPFPLAISVHRLSCKRSSVSAWDAASLTLICETLTFATFMVICLTVGAYKCKHDPKFRRRFFYSVSRSRGQLPTSPPRPPC